MNCQHYKCNARALPLLAIALAIAPAARAEQLPVPSAPFAWGEAIGWVNFNTGYVTLTDSVMSGYAWSESTGWINLGDGSPDSPPNYSNASATDFGVNNDGSGGLSGYAWSESLGWIVFDTSGAGGAQVTVDESGQMQGYAWSESAGWIGMNSGYGVLLETVAGEGEEGEGNVDGNTDGEGGREGEGAVDGEGTHEGEGISEGEGIAEGNVEGLVEGEGIAEGEGVADGEGSQEGEVTTQDAFVAVILRDFALLDVERTGKVKTSVIREAFEDYEFELSVEELDALILLLDSNADGDVTVGELRQLTSSSPIHGGDLDGDGSLNLTELLRAIQFYNAGGFGCASTAGDTEDGYSPESQAEQCRPYTADYLPQDWALDLSELLRAIQLYNLQDIEFCPGSGEDGFCPKVE